jgi:hypothetical protein
MTDEHQALLDQYYAEMRDAMSVAEAWWKQRLAAEVTESPRAADAEVRRRWPDGAASHPLVIGVIQKFLRLCHELNERLGPELSEDLNRFVIEGLMSDESRDIAKFTRSLSYWPIGLSGNELV